MVDLTYQFRNGIAKDVLVQIDDHFIPIDFLVLDMGEDDYDLPLILGRPFLNTIEQSSILGREKFTSNSHLRRYVDISLIIQFVKNPRRTNQGGTDLDIKQDKS